MICSLGIIMTIFYKYKIAYNVNQDSSLLIVHMSHPYDHRCVALLYFLYKHSTSVISSDVA